MREIAFYLRTMLGCTLLAGALAHVAHGEGPPQTLMPRLTPADASPSAEQLVPVRLLADRATIRPGDVFDLAVHFEIAEHWHVYWKDPGASGAATTLQIEAPDGFEVGPVRYPRPTRFAEPDGETFGYANQAVLFVQVRAPAKLPSESLTFNATIDWLVCRGVCKIGHARRTITLDAAVPRGAQHDGRAATEDHDLLQHHRARLPGALVELEGSRLQFSDGLLTLEGPTGAFDAVSFFPIESPGVTWGDPRITVTRDHFLIRIEIDLNVANAMGEPLIPTGLVALGTKVDDPAFEFSIPLQGSSHLLTDSEHMVPGIGDGK